MDDWLHRVLSQQITLPIGGIRLPWLTLQAFMFLIASAVCSLCALLSFMWGRTSAELAVRTPLHMATPALTAISPTPTQATATLMPAVPSAMPTQQTPSATPATATPLPASTPLPSPAPSPTETPFPTATATPPGSIPEPTSTPPVPSATPVSEVEPPPTPTFTVPPKVTPTPTLPPTDTPVPAPTPTSSPSATPTRTPTATPARRSDVRIIYVEYAGYQNEHVLIHNFGNADQDMTGWTLQDEDNHVYTFPAGFILRMGAEVRVWTKRGSDTELDLYWGLGTGIWSSSGETATLTDAQGNEISTYTWGGGIQ